jgi:signal-transduction protein with cAMP-binding, CBS, and nucleotidyltransferase domain
MKIIGQFMQIMTDNHIRHLPMGNGQKRMGLISIGDVVREMIAHQKSMSDQIQSCITGWPVIYVRKSHPKALT